MSTKEGKSLCQQKEAGTAFTEGDQAASGMWAGRAKKTPPPLRRPNCNRGNIFGLKSKTLLSQSFLRRVFDNEPAAQYYTVINL